MPALQSPEVVAILFLLQGVWGLFLVILTWAMRRVLTDIEENTRATNKVSESVNAINVLLSGNYVTKGEYDRLEARTRDLEQKVTRLDTRMEVHGQ
jgi:hypothetical protein